MSSKFSRRERYPKPIGLRLVESIDHEVFLPFPASFKVMVVAPGAGTGLNSDVYKELGLLGRSIAGRRQGWSQRTLVTCSYPMSPLKWWGMFQEWNVVMFLSGHADAMCWL